MMHKHNPYALLISHELTSEKLGPIATAYKTGQEKLSQTAAGLSPLEAAFRDLRSALASRAR